MNLTYGVNFDFYPIQYLFHKFILFYQCLRGSRVNDKRLGHSGTFAPSSHSVSRGGCSPLEKMLDFSQLSRFQIETLHRFYTIPGSLAVGACDVAVSVQLNGTFIYDLARGVHGLLFCLLKAYMLSDRLFATFLLVVGLFQDRLWLPCFVP